MRRGIITSLAVLALWGSVGLNFAAAQFGTLGQAPPRRPAVSPYINLGLGGASGYYGIIRPQIDAARSITDLQMGLNRLNPDGSIKASSDQSTTGQTGLQTGHAATFFNYGHYYPVTPTGGTTALGNAGFGPGLGGLNSGLGSGLGGGIGFGVGGIGAFGGNRGVGSTFVAPIIRP